MMKAAEATDGLRAAHNLPCSARDVDKTGLQERGGESFSACSAPAAIAAAAAASTPAALITCKQLQPNSHAHAAAAADDKKVVASSQVLVNLMQTGGLKSKLAPLPAPAASAAGFMERRRRCSCSCGDQPPSLSSSNGGLNVGSFHGSFSSCNCNMENCAWFPPDEAAARAAPVPASFKAQQPWRSSSDQTNTNAALHRALSAMKKFSGEPEAVKKAAGLQAKAIHSRGAGSDVGYGAWGPPNSTLSEQQQQLEMANARLITNPDARTLSMRERGRWGNSKMQQQRFAQPAAAAVANCAGTGHGVLQSAGKMNLSSDHVQAHHRHPQALQHVQCLHCGSFSTTPVAGVTKGAATPGRSQSFGRKVRDYSWQQELLQEQKRPAEAKEAAPGGAPPNAAVRQGGGHMDHHRCEYARCADMFPEYDHAATAMKLQHLQGPGPVMSWQERYMLLCQAIAAGAFVDGGADDMSGPILPASRGYSWAVCECAACEMGSAAAAVGGGFRQAPPPGFCNSTSAEARMMELEAFSGPLGYVSESKAGAELSSLMEKRPGGRRRWWARLPSFGGKSKSNSNCTQTAAATTAGRAAFGQNTAQCSSCGQRVWARGEEEEEQGGRLCPDCIVRTGSNKSESGPLPGPTAANNRPAAAPRAARPRPPPPAFSSHHKHLPRRWRLMKLCRYLMGFPLQR